MLPRAMVPGSTDGAALNQRQALANAAPWSLRLHAHTDPIHQPTNKLCPILSARERRAGRCILQVLGGGGLWRRRVVDLICKSPFECQPSAAIVRLLEPFFHMQACFAVHQLSRANTMRARRTREPRQPQAADPPITCTVLQYGVDLNPALRFVSLTSTQRPLAIFRQASLPAIIAAIHLPSHREGQRFSSRRGRALHGMLPQTRRFMVSSWSGRELETRLTGALLQMTDRPGPERCRFDSIDTCARTMKTMGAPFRGATPHPRRREPLAWSNAPATHR